VRLANPVAKWQWPFQNLFRDMDPLVRARVG
jgi:hypothetical protein